MEVTFENRSKAVAEKVIYKAVKGSRITDQEAETYGSRLDVLYEQNSGNLTPDTVLDDAKSPESPMHGYFEWDNTVAANEYRKTQAAYLLRSINVVITYEQKEVEVRKYLPIEHKEMPDSTKLYTPIEVVLTSDDMRKQVLKNALRELQSWQRKYQIYSELSAVFKAIEKVAKKIE